jgi:hypothetical protein
MAASNKNKRLILRKLKKILRQILAHFDAPLQTRLNNIITEVENRSGGRKSTVGQSLRNILTTQRMLATRLRRIEANLHRGIFHVALHDTIRLEQASQLLFIQIGQLLSFVDENSEEE